MTLVAESDVLNGLERVKPSKSVGLCYIPSSSNENCTESFIPVLKFVFSFSLSQQNFPTLWKQQAVIPLFQERNSASLSNSRPIYILNHFPGVFELIVRNCVFHYIKSKSNPYPYGFIKQRSIIINLATFHDYVTVIPCLQGQVDSICFDLSTDVFHMTSVSTSLIGHVDYFLVT